MSPRALVLKISTKRVSVGIFSVLVHQMCVLYTNKLAIAYSFAFGEMSQERPRNLPKRHTPLDTQLADPKSVKNLIRPFVLL